jgi:ABC-2 type transport system ATP-binding protein
MAQERQHFKSLAGLLPHDGDVLFDDNISLKSHPVEFRKRLSYGEAEPLYPGFLTAKDLIHFIGKTKGASLLQQRQLTERFGINSFFENSCETYSSGMLKKLSIALAFLGAPRVIILDEPLITLDEQGCEILFQLINESIINDHVTFLLSSHQLIEHTSIAIVATYLIENKTIVTV